MGAFIRVRGQCDPATTFRGSPRSTGKAEANVRIGVTFPQTEFGNDPIAIRDFAQTVEGLRYRHLLAYDHVLGADTSVRPDWSGPYTSLTPFHEIFVLFGFLA